MPLPTQPSPAKPRGAGTRACRADTRVGACARPRVILGALNQSGLYRIVLNVFPNPIHFDVVPNPMIVGFPLPEGVSGEPEDFVSLAGSHTFQPAEQKRRSNLRQQQNVNMVGHQNPRPKLIVREFNAAEQRSNHNLRDRFQLQVQRAFLRGVEIPVQPDKSLAGGKLPRRRKSPLRQTAVQMPCGKDPFSFGILMGQPTAEVGHRPLVLFGDDYSQPMNKRRHECPDHRYHEWVTLSGDKACPVYCDSPSRHECPRHDA